jgi:hypothetical protein
MKFMKYLFALAFALCATANVANAQATIKFLGGGSSALFLELGQAAQSAAATGTPCVWTQRRPHDSHYGREGKRLGYLVCGHGIVCCASGSLQCVFLRAVGFRCR